MSNTRGHKTTLCPNGGEAQTGKQLSPQQIEALRAIDTPTLCNAIEKFGVRSEVDGFMGMDIHCITPEFGTMLGYAITVTVDSTTPGVPKSRSPRGAKTQRGNSAWQAWLKAMDSSPKPGVLVLKDIGPQPRKSAHLGEMMGTMAKRLGVVGVITDGGLRDILELKRLGLHLFCAGIVPAHGNPRLIEVNVPVEVDGVLIQPGDLLHGDINGVTTIPLSIADQVVAAALHHRTAEAALLAYINSPEFTVEGLEQRTVRH
jgi:4-hydroxy-4-methyl-2-oxoglutarate aldolase